MTTEEELAQTRRELALARHELEIADAAYTAIIEVLRSILPVLSGKEAMAVRILVEGESKIGRSKGSN